MRTAPFVLTAALACLAASTPAAPVLAHGDPVSATADGVRIQAVLEADLAAGRIDFEEYLLQNFRLVFARDRVDPAYVRTGALLDPCFTPWIAELERRRNELSAAAIAEIEGYLVRPRSGLRATYISPSGRFELTYETSGPNAVPADDVAPANGIPDYVEMCGSYYDESWNRQITILGFTAPLLPSDGSYDCYFEALPAGLFGYTSSAGAGRTTITIDNDFLGFGHVHSPDPDGLQAGRAKGVIAHEFKHASQFTQSGWSEGSWNELDANWVMDVVFDASDIYHAWLSDPTSQLSSPQTTLPDDGGAGNYEDLLWETYMGERFGLQCVVDFGARRKAFMGESVKASYQQVLLAYGSSWDLGYPEFMEWCWFTGSRSHAGLGFEEAASMSRMALLEPAIGTYPYAASGSVDELAAHHRRFNRGAATGFPRVIFNGDDAHCCWTVSVLLKDTAGTVTIVRPALNAANDVDYTVPTAFPNVEYVGVIVTNSQRSGGVKPYTLDVLDAPGPSDAPTPSAVLAALPSLGAGTPNPFRGATRLKYSVPAAAAASLRIYDVHGRVVRSLLEGELGAGPGTAVWDGRDDAGRPAPAGVYWSRLETPWGEVARKVTLLR